MPVNNYCCNPFMIKGHGRKYKDLRKVKQPLQELWPTLILGDFICGGCRLKINRKNRSRSRTREVSFENSTRLSDARSRSRSSSPSSSVVSKSPSLDTDVSLDLNSQIQYLNTSLSALGISPINSKKLRSREARLTKLENIHEQLKQKLLSDPDDSDDYIINNDNEIIAELKAKFNSVDDFSEKVSILTVLPKSWTSRKI